MRWRPGCATACQLPLLLLPPLPPPRHLLPLPQAVTSPPHRLPSLICAVQLRPHHLDECAQQRGQEEVHQPGGEPTVTAGPASATLLKRCAEAWNGMAWRALRSITVGASGVGVPCTYLQATAALAGFASWGACCLAKPPPACCCPLCAPWQVKTTSLLHAAPHWTTGGMSLTDSKGGRHLHPRLDSSAPLLPTKKRKHGQRS